MQVELSDEDRDNLLNCINTAIKAAPNAINASAQLMPLVAKLTTKPTTAPDPEPVKAD
jgi:hypothetical protein